jgi:hypothetical protein
MIAKLGAGTHEVEGWPKDISSHRISPDRTREVLERARWS